MIQLAPTDTRHRHGQGWQCPPIDLCSWPMTGLLWRQGFIYILFVIYSFDWFPPLVSPWIWEVQRIVWVPVLCQGPFRSTLNLGDSVIWCWGREWDRDRDRDRQTEDEMKRDIHIYRQRQRQERTTHMICRHTQIRWSQGLQHILLAIVHFLPHIKDI